MNSGVHQSSWRTLEEAEVWDAFRESSNGAFEFIYHNHIRSLYSYGMQIFPEASVVEDVVQELFIELWNNRNRLSGTNNIRFYLMKALRNRLIDLYRANSRSYGNIEKYVQSEGVRVTLPHEDLLVAEQITEERRLRLFQVLDKLTPRQREVIDLLFFEKMTYEEVSELMSMNLRSVYTLAWKAINAVKKYFQSMD